MFDKNKVIKTLDDAKEFFLAMGCSSFHMDREYPSRYTEFKSLNISKDILKLWQQENIDSLFKKINRKHCDNLAPSIHHYLDLVGDAINKKNIKNAYKIIKRNYKKVFPLDVIVIAETISDTSTALSFHCIASAKRLGLNRLYKKYINLRFKMLTYACNKDSSLLERAKYILYPKAKYELANEILETLKKHLEE